MNITTFDELLQAARSQPDAQRLLMVFVGASIPEDASPEQRARFEAGEGGEITPLMGVDKTPDEINNFAELLAESRQMGPEWSLVFVAGLSGQGGRAPTSEEADGPLQGMVQAIKDGMFDRFIPFNTEGQAVFLDDGA